MALPVYAEVDLLPDAPDEVELLEDKQGTASGEDTVPPEQNAATPVPDAATPEPEQSAEPEQPAPTETPEPTAEPTPTPEPAATATATPTPTVTPTATPEPTEQPQKMYAAESVDNVQAASEPEAAEGFTVYFVVPDKINGETVSASHEIRFNVKTDETPGNSNDGAWWHTHTMEPTGWETNGHKIYAVKNCKDIQGKNFLEIQFQLYEGSDWKGEIKLNNNLGPISEFNNKMYDPTTNNGEWTDNPVLKEHTYYAGKPIKFENRSTANLTSVKANFYIPDEKSETLTLVNDGSEAEPVAKEEFVTFTIPDVECSYVQFTWDEGGQNKSSKFYNFYGETVSGDKESFIYSEANNCFIYTGADNVRWGIEKSVLIYYDATFSKMALNGDTGDFSIPKANQSTVYYRLKGKDKESKSGPMSRIEGTDYYAADVPDGYTQIVFSSHQLSSDDITTTCGDTTGWEDIPENYKDTEQCFYADTNDDAVYSNGQRGGYWAPKDTKRDAETWKNAGKVVDIAPADFTEVPDTKYVTSTLYDYYTDYELNGNNRDNYNSTYYTPGEGGGFASQRSWVTFRQFDRALSDYYSNCKAQYPIYTGHFQPTYSNWGITFETISAALNLWGFNKDFENKNRFMAINNSTINEDGSGTRYDYAYQGLVKDKTSTGDATGEPLLKDTTTTVEPHFNKEFLSGTNTKNAKLGDVYDNVAFPFTKRQIFDEDQGVDYWYFDSQDTTLYLKQDSTTEQYFLKSSTENRERSRNLDSNSAQKSINKNGQSVSSYGYFPFNETATAGRASTYNYGFGTKLQMDFTLTDDGMVETNKTGEDGKKEKTNIKFFFSGDDDVWVFIDGQLALDVGGAHGEVSGLLEFGETDTEDGKKNSVTAYVSKVKTGGTSGSDKDDKNGNSPVKTVTYNKEVIKFYAQGTTLPLDKGQKHTLTMYYMERGMWESNMAVAFNFPDNNELQVQKVVDLKNVTDDDFRNCFKNQKIFNFTIQNQATHYGTTLAAKPNPSDTEKVNLTATGNTIKPATEPTESNKGDYIFELVKNPWPDSKPDSGQDPGQDTGQNTEQVLHWYARYMDTQSAAREKRRGILTLENPINIKDMRFLTFQVYVDTTDGSEGDLSLNNLYLELLDENDVQKGSLGTSGINGATYGSVEVKTGAWVTVKLDLNKMKAQDGFNGKVKTIRVGDNYSRHIYFRNFTFIPKAVPKTMTGFTTDQKEIPDYGSATSGQLQNAINAQYTSTKDNDTQLVDDDGRFVLEDGETVTFSDQFRRGSYISLKEELNENLYDTKWTVCENGKEVESMSGGKSVSLLDPAPPLIEQKGSGPDDGRTEKITSETEQESGNVQNIYNGQKPTTANTIVFRSYKDPDETKSTLTKLKVKYVNTVKTGGLKIQKKAAEGETLTGTYTFKVTFNDVGGAGLEKEDIIRYVEIDMTDEKKYPDHTVTITGIPVGTRYTIEEETPLDGSRLQSVTVPKGCDSADVIDNTVEGVIKEPNTCPITAIFTNTRRTLINIEFDKLWKDANGKDDLSTAKQPKQIYIQLQRRLATSTKDDDWTPVNYGTKAYVTITPDDNNGWKHTFSGLDQRQVGETNTNYQYRIVEGTVDKAGNFTAVKPNETITINGNTYVVTAEAEATANSETNSAGSSTDNTATANSETNSETGATTTPATVTPDGTITGGSGKIVLTNTLQNPKFALDIIKKDAEPNNAGEEVFLKDVEFKLEKLKQAKTGGTQWEVDTSYTFNNNDNLHYLTGTTGTDGEIKNNPFKDLEPGRYRLTETKAHEGYNLLSKSIDIEFTQDGKYKIDDGPAQKATGDAASGYTVTFTVLNRKTPELPHTGADAPSLWLLIGMPLAVAGLLIFTFRYNRKGGRRH